MADQGNKVKSDPVVTDMTEKSLLDDFFASVTWDRDPKHMPDVPEPGDESD